MLRPPGAWALRSAATSILLVAGLHATDASAAVRTKAATQTVDRALVRSAQTLNFCLHKGRTCDVQHQSLQKAGARAVAVDDATPDWLAPGLRVVRNTLSWVALDGDLSYIVRATIDGQPDTFTVVSDSSFTPEAIPGETVTYRMRNAAVGSAWSLGRTITYAGSKSDPDAGTGATGATGAAASAAPEAPVTSSAPATPLSEAPAAAPPASGTDTSAGGTASGGTGGTASGGSTSTPTTSTPTPPTPPAVPYAGPRIGVVVGSAIAWQLQFVTQLGAHSARMEFPIQTPVSSIAPIVLAYAQAGVQVDLLAGFAGRIPTSAETTNLGTWAAAFGPGGSFWQGKAFPASLAVDRIEFGNESSGPWEYSELSGVSDWEHTAFYADLAERYARSFKNASIALRGAGNGVKLLAVADAPGRWPQWVDGMFRAVPDLGDYVGGWSVHPYGPDWKLNIDEVLSQVRGHGASDSIGLYITETGLSTDDGKCLTDNAGWGKCVTYAQAALILTTSVSGIIAEYGSRLKELDIYSASDICTHEQSDDRECYFGALNSTTGLKGPFTDAAKAILARTS